MSPEATRKAAAGRPGRAYCPACGRQDVETEMEGLVERYRAHNRVMRGGASSCRNSGEPVVPRTGRPR